MMNLISRVFAMGPLGRPIFSRSGSAKPQWYVYDLRLPRSRAAARSVQPAPESERRDARPDRPPERRRRIQIVPPTWKNRSPRTSQKTFSGSAWQGRQSRREDGNIFGSTPGEPISKTLRGNLPETSVALAPPISVQMSRSAAGLQRVRL